jgi:thiamine biosynthesis protein ThiI
MEASTARASREGLKTPGKGLYDRRHPQGVLFLVRYGEIGLKSPYVIRQLTDRLVGNILEMFKGAGIECHTRREYGRIFVGADDTGAIALLRRTFGIVSFSPVEQLPADLEVLKVRAGALAQKLLRPGRTFAIRARRVGEQGPPSLEVARILGREVQRAVPGAPVDLDSPDTEIFVEVRGSSAYLYSDVIPGPGGLPLGSQGRVAALVEDERGMAAAWLMMRRGCKVLVADAGGPVEHLRRWDVNMKVMEARTLDALDNAATTQRCRALIVGWSLKEILERPQTTSLPIFHPLVGYTPEEIERLIETVIAG